MIFLFSLIFLLLNLLHRFLSVLFGKNATSMREDAYQEALKILDEARVKSLKILGDSQLKAQKTLKDMGSLNEGMKKDLDKRIEQLYLRQEEDLKEFGDGFIQSYRQAANEKKDESIKSLVQSTEEIKNEVISDMEEFKNVVKKETMGVQEEMEEKLKKNYAEVDKEISEYKERKIKEINGLILLLLSDISEEVIGKSMDQTDYEKYVLKRLGEEIKKLGLAHATSSSN